MSLLVTTRRQLRKGVCMRNLAGKYQTYGNYNILATVLTCAAATLARQGRMS